MLNLSIVICTKNRPKDLIRCIESLNNQTYLEKELIIIESGIENSELKNNELKNNELKNNELKNNELNELKIDATKYSNIKYSIYNSSLTVARNMGIDQSKGDIILFLDDDVILDKNYIFNIVQVFEKYKDIGCACGDIVSDSTRSKRFPKYIEYTWVKKIRNLIFNIFFLPSWGDGKFHPSGFPTYPIGKKDIMHVECLQGVNMAFRKDVLEEFKFDENLQGYCFMEDCDMSYRVSREYKIVYTPYARLIHNVSPTSRYSDFSKMKMAIQNHRYIFNKNFPQNSYHKFAFWISVSGLIFICLLGTRKEGIKGIYEGLKIIFNNKEHKKGT